MASLGRTFSFRVVSFWVLNAGILWAQGDINEVHIAPQESPAILAKASMTEPGLNNGIPIIKKQVDMVLVSVTITDSMDRLITGLTRENFQIFEGKTLQRIQHFSNEDAPVSLGIVMDASRSMRDKMERVRDAVTQFCNDANPQDEFFLITFSDGPRLATDFTTRSEEIQNKLVTIGVGGRTALLDAVYMGVDKMKDAKYSRKALLIISDGGDNHSRYTAREVKSLVREGDVMIYAVGIFDRSVTTEEELRGPELLSEVAQESGGRAFTIDNSNDMDLVVRRVGLELRNQYVLAYRPENAPHDGKWHKIKIKLKAPKHFDFLRLRAKPGYYAGIQ